MGQLFVVTYSYGPAEEQAKYRPEHRAYLNRLLEQGLLKVAGPHDEPQDPGATLILEAESRERVQELIDADPMARGGAVLRADVRAWNPSVGAIG